MKQLIVHFTETPQEEIHALMRDLRFADLAKLLAKGQELSPDMEAVLGQFVAVVADLFSDAMPTIPDDPAAALRTVSRDINLSRILRERGIFRMYILLNKVDENNLPVYMTLENPNTGGPFATQEEFIGWFCGEASVSRSLLFMRLASIERLLSLDFSLEEALKTIMSKPYAVRETLNTVAEWDKGELVSVDLDGITRLAARLQPDSLPEITKLVDSVREGKAGAVKNLNDAAKPIIADLMREVTAHENAKDALAWVKHNLLERPEIQYILDPETNVLYIEMVVQNTDTVTGEVFMGAPITVPFIPDIVEVPHEIMDDLAKRLPLRTKSTKGSLPF